MHNLKKLAAALVMATAIAPVATLATSTAAHAQDDKKSKKTKKAKPGKIGAKVAAPLQAAQQLALEKKWTEALAKVNEAEAISPKTPIEEMAVQDMKAYVCLNLKDYACATTAAEAAFNTNAWGQDEKGQRLKNLAQLTLTTKDYAKAIAYGDRHLAEVGQDPVVISIVAQAHYFSGNYQKALDISQNAARAAEQAGQKPDEAYLQIALFSAVKLKNNPAARDALFKLVEFYPSPDYWSDLVNTLHSRADMTEHYSLDVFRLGLAAGTLQTADDYVEMAQTAMQLGLPGEAQRALDKGFAAGVLSTANQRALRTQATQQSTADKATIAGQASAASGSAKGDDDIKIAEAYETYGDNDKALALVTSGLSKPGLKAPDEARVLLGRIQLNLMKKAEAIETFKSVKTDPKYADLARAWALHANQKL